MVPLKGKELKQSDYAAIEKYACQNTRFNYEEKEEYAKVGEETYDLEVDFDFHCEVLHFIDDKIRIRYFNNFTNPIVGVFTNTSSEFNKTGKVPESLRYRDYVTISSASNFE